MPNPRTLKVNLSSYGYHMGVDTRKSDCNRERTPHWHLCSRYGREGSISIYGKWVKEPNVDRNIRKEAEELTARYAREISEVYEHNRIDGADY